MASERPGGRHSVGLNEFIFRFAETSWCTPLTTTDSTFHPDTPEDRKGTACKSYTSLEVSLVPTTDVLESTPPKSNKSTKVSTPDTSVESSSLSSINMSEELEGAASVLSIQGPPQIRRVYLDRNVKTINDRADDNEVNSIEQFRSVSKRLPTMVFETIPCQSISDEVPSDEEDGQLNVLKKYGLTQSPQKVSLLSTGKPTVIQLHTVVGHSEEDDDDVSSSASVSMFDKDDLKAITARQIGTYLSVDERYRIGSKVLQAKAKSGHRVVETSDGVGLGSLCETCSMPRCRKTSTECPICPVLKMNVLKNIIAGESPVYDYVAAPQLTFGVQETSRQSELNRVAINSGGPPMQQLLDAEEFVLAARQSMASSDLDNESSKLCAFDEALQIDKGLAAVDKARKSLTSKLSAGLQAGNEGCGGGSCNNVDVKRCLANYADQSCRGFDLDEGKEALAQAKQSLVQKIDLVSKAISPIRSAIAKTVAKQGSSEYVSLNQARTADDLKDVALEEDFSCAVQVSMTSEAATHDEGDIVMLDATMEKNARDNRNGDEGDEEKVSDCDKEDERTNDGTRSDVGGSRE